MSINLQALTKAKGISVSFADVESSVNGTAEKALRQELGFTQSVMASLLHVSTKTIEKWEEGANPIVGGDAVLIFLLMENHQLVRSLISIKKFNKAVVSEPYQAFVECCDNNAKPIKREYTDPVYPVAGGLHGNDFGTHADFVYVSKGESYARK